MVKKRHRTIPLIPFEGADGLGLEVVGLQELIAREMLHDLSQPQRPTFHHFILPTRGVGIHTVDFRRHRLSKGSLLYVAPGQVQQFSLARSLDATMIVFQPDFVRRAPEVWPAPLRLKGVRGATVASLFGAIVAEWRGGSRRVLQALVEALIEAADAGATEQPALHRRFLLAVERSFTRAHEVAAYAAILDCSPRTLARICERASGQSAKEVIDARVALEARRMLAHGTAPAAQISEQLGFAEPTQFGKFFRRLTGGSPARFRAGFQK